MTAALCLKWGDISSCLCTAVIPASFLRYDLMVILEFLKGMWPRGHVLQSSLPALSAWYRVSLLQKKCRNPNFFSAIWKIDICAAFCELQGLVVFRSRSILKHVLFGNLVKCCVQGGRVGWWGRAQCISFCLHLIFCHVEKQLCKEMPDL